MSKYFSNNVEVLLVRQLITYHAYKYGNIFLCINSAVSAYLFSIKFYKFLCLS